MTYLILVVDDEDVIRVQVRDLLEEAGYKVVEASNGQQALAVYVERQPDLVLVDALMPGMDGFTFCEQLQVLPGKNNVPILMITAFYDRLSVERAFAVGVTDLMTKPIQWQVLRQRVRHLIEASRAMQELRQQTEQAQNQEAKLRIALEAARMGTWDWDILTNQITWSDNLKIAFGVDSNARVSDITYEAFLERIHPKDRDFVSRSVMQTLQTGAEYNIEFRMILPNGAIRWSASQGVVERLPSGKAIRMYGIDMDVTKRKEAEEELQRQSLRSHLFADITVKIRQSLQIDEILLTSVKEVQKLLQADRVLILRLRSDGSIAPVKEAVLPGLPVVMGSNLVDPCFKESYIVTKYRLGHISSITDIEQVGIQPCHVQFLKQFGVKSNLVVPILLQNQLWGLLIAHQCKQPRVWDTWESELLRQLADQVGIALAQAKMLEQETLQRQELARSNEELQQFAFIASHDLQEPLRKIKTFGDRLKATCGNLLTEQGKDYLTRMQNATLRMQALIEDLLTLSRVTTRAQPFKPVDLAQTIQEVLSDLEVRIQQTQGHIEVGELPIIIADSLQMHQLLQNLISNALKFHRPNEPSIVKIYSQSAGEYYQIIIEDNGIGFDEKYLDRIFNVFQRLHGRSEYEGTGIGLAICRKIVERHQGSITAQSQLGQGSKFIITLPIHDPSEPLP